MTDAEVLEALPSTGFLHDYVEYASKRTDAHNSFHLASGLTVLASVADERLSTYYTGSRLQSNIWFLTLGSSGSGKTTSINIARELIKEARPSTLCDMPGSDEGFVDALSINPNTLLIYPEFGDFLVKTQSGYSTPLRMRLAQVYDCLPVSRVLARGKRTTVPFPRVSMLAGATPDHLERYTETVDWPGGVLSTLCLVTGSKEKDYPVPTEDATGRAKLVRSLTQIAGSPIGRCDGFTDKAARLVSELCMHRDAALRGGGATAEMVTGSL